MTDVLTSPTEPFNVYVCDLNTPLSYAMAGVIPFSRCFKPERDERRSRRLSALVAAAHGADTHPGTSLAWQTISSAMTASRLFNSADWIGIMNTSHARWVLKGVGTRCPAPHRAVRSHNADTRGGFRSSTSTLASALVVVVSEPSARLSRLVVSSNLTVARRSRALGGRRRMGSLMLRRPPISPQEGIQAGQGSSSSRSLVQANFEGVNYNLTFALSLRARSL